MTSASNQHFMNNLEKARTIGSSSPCAVAAVVSDQQLAALSNDPMMISKADISTATSKQSVLKNASGNVRKLPHAKSTGCLPSKPSKVQSSLERSFIMKSAPELRKLLTEEEERMLLAARIQERSRECAKGASQIRRSLAVLGHQA